MTWLSEDPTFIVITGAILVVILIIGFLKNGRASILGAALGVLAAVIGLVLLERVWVTDYEKVENRIYAAAAALETNDVDTVMEHLSPNATAFRVLVPQVLPMFKIEEINLTSVQITLNELTSPPTAIVDFVALAEASYRGQQPLYQKTPVPMQVELEKVGDEWLLSNYLSGPESRKLGLR